MITRLLFILFCCVQLKAQNFNAAPFHAMGNTGLALESVYSLTNNPAGIARLTQAHVALAFESHFMIKDLSTQAAYAALPIKNVGALGVSVRKYGIQNVSSFLTSNLVYARNFGGVFSTAVSANYHRYHVSNYTNDNTFSLDLGAQ